MKKIANAGGKDWIISDSPHPPYIRDPGGRPRDKRLEELDDRMAKLVVKGHFENPREAARSNLEEYARPMPENREHKNEKIRDFTRRIQRRIDEIMCR